MTTSSSLGRRSALAAVVFERYGLSLAYLGLGAYHLHRLWINGPGQPNVDGTLLAGIARQVIQLQLEVYVGVLLLVGRRAVVLPQTLQDVLVPLLATFFNATYSAVPILPVWLRKNLCPMDLQTPLAAAGLFLNLVGLAVAVWGALSLGRSFGVLIEMKQIVREGAYRRVRHPMYAGYLCLLTGLALANGSLAFLILVPAHVGLLVCRAWLEEARLADHSLEYREYQKTAGFIFPKLGRPRTPPV
ncbi:MAG TPA: isoprenylcysteine carboxylmethyltransferase family protein [Candidatus Acidoferrum sp.]|nr:isoprenylcysteine carboxylmethyltransferase family protein [Candidatus Acidoferrum sp.]